MKHTFTALVFLAMPSSAIAQEMCQPGDFGWDDPRFGGWSLVMNPPEVSEEFVLSEPATAKKKLLLARQQSANTPALRYLTGDIDIQYNDREKLSKFMPLTKGSPISIWRRGNEERHCTISWRGGLFGGATGEGHYRWACLEDSDNDGKYDTAWRPKGNSKRIYMPFEPAVGWTEEAPATDGEEPAKGLATDYPTIRTLEVSKLNRKIVRIQYWGAGVGPRKENRVELSVKEPGSATLGGVTINLTPGEGKAAPTLSVSGSLEPQDVTASCNGSSYSIGDFQAEVRFGFPSW